MEISKFSKDNEGQYSFKGVIPPTHTHYYEVFPWVYNSTVSDSGGTIISKQSYHKDGSKHKVIYNGDITIVILDDGTKGIAKRNPNDTYDKFLGYKIAKIRADIAKQKRELDKLTK